MDGLLQDTAAAVIPVPAGLTKAMLNIVFAEQPAARLGGAYGEVPRAKAWWSRLRRRFQPIKLECRASVATRTRRQNGRRLT